LAGATPAAALLDSALPELEENEEEGKMELGTGTGKARLERRSRATARRHVGTNVENGGVRCRHGVRQRERKET
jgi:hypothetical protein